MSTRGVTSSRTLWTGSTVVILTLCLLTVPACGTRTEPVPTDDTTGTIGPEGGKITVEDPNSLVQGMVIEVPAGSFESKTTFKVTTRPYEGETSTKLHPLTPVIDVANGGAFSEEVMTVTIPIDLPKGMFAMGFFVNEDGKLEGMPIVDLTPRSITIATRHFSEFIVSAMMLELAKGIIRTKFRPGVDDWPFRNRGSYIAPRGHCAGQTITAAWYFYEKKLAGGKPLHDFYDNNTRKPATPDLWEDDSWAYRFASTVQRDIRWSGIARKSFNALAQVSPQLTWRAFLYSVHMTGDPQYVSIYSTKKEAGHALLVYAVDTEKGLLHVADPNYAGKSDRRIAYENGAFKPYHSGSSWSAIKAGGGTNFDQIRYNAKTSLVPWAKVAAQWDQFRAGTVGNDKFPAYKLVIKSGPHKGRELNNSLQIDTKELRIKVEGDEKYGLKYRITQGKKWSSAFVDATMPFKMGSTLLGFHVTGLARYWGKDAQGEKIIKKARKYVDFRWVDIERVVEMEEPEADEPKAKPVYDAVITGIYYGEVQSKTRRRGPMLFVTDATGKYPLRTAYQILQEKKDDFGNVTETAFRFKRGYGSPGIPPGRRRVCVGSTPGVWIAKSAVITVGTSSSHQVTIGQPPKVH